MVAGGDRGSVACPQSKVVHRAPSNSRSDELLSPCEQFASNHNRIAAVGCLSSFKSNPKVTEMAICYPDARCLQRFYRLYSGQSASPAYAGHLIRCRSISSSEAAQAIKSDRRPDFASSCVRTPFSGGEFDVFAGFLKCQFDGIQEQFRVLDIDINRLVLAEAVFADDLQCCCVSSNLSIFSFFICIAVFPR